MEEMLDLEEVATIRPKSCFIFCYNSSARTTSKTWYVCSPCITLSNEFALKLNTTLIKLQQKKFNEKLSCLLNECGRANLMSILRGNDIGINADIWPDKKLAYRGELVLRLGAVRFLPQLRRRPGRYRGGNLEVVSAVWFERESREVIIDVAAKLGVYVEEAEAAAAVKLKGGASKQSGGGER